MPSIFRPKKSNRNECLICFPLFVLIGIGSAYAFWWDNASQKLIVSVSLFWAGWACISLWGLLSYDRSRLVVDDRTITQRGVLFQKQIDLADVTQARWRPGRSGSLKLHSGTQTLTVRFGNYEKPHVLWLIRHFRNHLPESVQHGWDLYCLMVAVPLRDGRLNDAPPAAPNDSVVPRRRWDLYFIPAILLSFVLVFVWHWTIEITLGWATPLALVLLWIGVRLSTPRSGFVARKQDPGEKRSLASLTAWSGLTFLGLTLFFPDFANWTGEIPYARPLGAIATAAGLAGICRTVLQADRHHRRRNRERAPTAVQQWEAGEACSVGTTARDDANSDQ